MNGVRPSQLLFGLLVLEQVKSVGLRLRNEAILLCLLLAILSVIGLYEASRSPGGLDAEPELLFAALPVTLILPFAVWRGERIFDDAFLWTLPVSRQRIALAKIVAGAFWTLIGILVVLCWILLMTLVTGGNVGETETRLVGHPRQPYRELAEVSWISPWWTWLVPFTSGIILYLLGSAAVIGLKHPIRVLAAMLFGVATLVAVVTALPSRLLKASLSAAQDALVEGPFGLDPALTAGVTGLPAEIIGSQGRPVEVWGGLPDAGSWVPAMLAWLVIAALMLALALVRHRESPP